MAQQTQAAYYTEFGGIDKIKVGFLDLPEVGEGEVLVRVKAAGINPVDYVVREGHFQAVVPSAFPTVPGWDVAGIVGNALGTEPHAWPKARKCTATCAARWPSTAPLPSTS